MTETNSVTDSIKAEFRHRGSLWVGIIFATIFGAIAGWTVCAYFIGERASKEVAGMRAAYAEATDARISQLKDVTSRLGQCLAITAKNGEAASSAANQAATAATQAANAAKDAATALDKVNTPPADGPTK